MKMKFMFTLLLGLAAVAVSCKKDNGNSTKIVAPESVTVSAAAGVSGISFSISNGSDDKVLTAKTETSWIHDVVVEKYKVSFSYDASNSAEERSGSIVLSYPGASDVTVTVKQKPADKDFVIEMLERTQTSATVQVTPVNGKDPYLVGFFPKSVYDANKSNLKGYVESQGLQEMASAAGMGVTDFVNGKSLTGAQKVSSGDIFEKSTSYCVLVFSANASGRVTSEVEAMSFKTLADPSDNKFTFTVSDLTSVSVNVVIGTTNNDTYLANIMPVSEYEKAGGTDEDYINALLLNYEAAGSTEDLLMSGENTLSANGLTPGTEYYVLAFGCDGKSNTTVLFKESFTTKEGNPTPDDVKFTFTVERVTGNYADIRYTPNLVFYNYCFGVMDEKMKNEYGSDVSKWGDFFMKRAQDAIDSNIAADVEEFVSKSCPKSAFYVRMEKLEFGTDYYPYAFLVDASGNVLGAPYVGEKFTTLEKPDGKPVLNVTVDKYFNGDELAEKYPGKYDDFKGKAVFPVRYESENSGLWYIGAMQKAIHDQYDAASYLEIAFVEMDGFAEVRLSSEDYPVDKGTVLLPLRWDVDMVILGLPYSDENMTVVGDWFKYSVKPETSGASPVSEFEDYVE